MAYLEPEEYAFFIEAFQTVGAPVLARVALLVNERRRTVGNSKNVVTSTLKRAWEVGWPRQHKMPPIKSLFPDYDKTGVLGDPVWPAPPSAESSVVSNQIETSERSETGEVKAPPTETGIASEPTAAPESLTVVASRHTLVSEAMDRLDAGRIQALANEVSALVLTRKNVVGVHSLLDKVLTKLEGKAQAILTRMVSDLETGENTNVKGWMSTLSEVVDMMKTVGLTFKMAQEAQRLLIGMPQRITEDRRPSSDDGEGEGMGKMAKLLRTRSAGPRAYGGEEKPVIIEATFTEPGTESASDPTNAVAKESDAEPIPAELKGEATG